MYIFFNYRISYVVIESNRSSKLGKFAGISEVPDESQVYEYWTNMTQRPIVILSIQYLESFLNHVEWVAKLLNFLL